MASTIKQFGYTILKMKKTDRPFSPVVYIDLENWSGSEGKSPRISHQLMSEGEIDAYIVALKEDLDAVGRRAKRAIKKAKDESLRFVAERKNSN